MMNPPSGSRLRHHTVRCVVAATWLCVATLIAACDGGDTAPASRPAASKAALPQARTVRFVRLEELTEWNGKAWASVAEFNLIDSTGATVDRKAWKASADSAGVNDQPANAIDGDPLTHWHTQWDGVPLPPPHTLTIDLGGTVRVSGFRYLPRQDRTVNGSIAKYRFYVSNDGVEWGTPVAEGDFTSMSAPTIEKTVVFAEQTANRAPAVQALSPQSTPMGSSVSVRIEATDADGDPLTFAASGLPAGLAIGHKTGRITGTPIVPGMFAVEVSVADGKGPNTKLAVKWAVPPPAALAVAIQPGEVRFVKLEALSEVNGKPWASIAEFNLIGADGANMSREGWTASADSADTSDGPGNAIDGNPRSLWHSQWDGAAPVPPHSLIVDLGRGASVRGFRYLPRQDNLSNGLIARFRFFTSVDGVTWGRPVSEGDFSTMGAVQSEKTVLMK